MTTIIFVDMIGDEILKEYWAITTTEKIQEFCIEQDWILEGIADHDDGVVEVIADNS